MKRKVIFIGIAGFTLLSALPALAASEQDCVDAFTRADINKDGVLTQLEGAQFFARHRAADKQIVDGRLTREAFMASCKADVYAAAKTDPGAPLAGANSFTESQAKDRASGAGFTDVSALSKDDKGVWRGTARQGGKQVSIAVDFKGNVVAN